MDRWSTITSTSLRRQHRHRARTSDAVDCDVVHALSAQRWQDVGPMRDRARGSLRTDPSDCPWRGQVAPRHPAVVARRVINRLRSSFSFATAASSHRRAFVSVGGLRYSAMGPRVPCNRQGRGAPRLNSWALATTLELPSRTDRFEIAAWVLAGLIRNHCAALPRLSPGRPWPGSCSITRGDDGSGRRTW